jgi:hypothetical protein
MGMQQNQTGPFPYEQLLPEVKVLVIQAVADSTNIHEAVAAFNNSVLTSKQFNTQQVSNVFLNALNTKFPAQEVRIARALNNDNAKHG